MRGFALGLSLSVAFVIGCVSSQALQPRVTAQPPPGPTARRWTYVCESSVRLGRLQQWMNERGAEGYEAAASAGADGARVVICMKRPY